MQPLPKGNRLGIITYSGGIGVLAIDQAAKYGLTGTKLMSQTEDALNRIAPGLGKMPVDIGPVAPRVKDYLRVYPGILEAVMADEHVDALFNVLWADTRGNTLKAYMGAYEGVRDCYGKPLVSWVYGTERQAVNDHVGHLEDLGFPVFRDPETSIKAIGMAFRYARMNNRCS
jgi:acetyltransferase